MNDQRYSTTGTALAVAVFIVAVFWFACLRPESARVNYHHCPQCEIAYSRGLFHGIDYAERGVARLDQIDGCKYIVWTGDAFGEKPK